MLYETSQLPLSMKFVLGKVTLSQEFLNFSWETNFRLSQQFWYFAKYWVLIHLFSKLFQILDENFLKTLWWFFSRFCDNFSFNFCWDFWWKFFKIFSQYFYQNFVIIFHSTFDEIFCKISSNFLWDFCQNFMIISHATFYEIFITNSSNFFTRFRSKLCDNFSSDFW